MGFGDILGFILRNQQLFDSLILDICSEKCQNATKKMKTSDQVIILKTNSLLSLLEILDLKKYNKNQLCFEWK